MDSLENITEGEHVSRFSRVKNRIKKSKFVKYSALSLGVLVGMFGAEDRAEALDFTGFIVSEAITQEVKTETHGRYDVWYEWVGSFTNVVAYDKGPNGEFEDGEGDDLGRIQVTSGSWIQFGPAVFDYNGEAFITYTDRRFGNADVRLARVINGVVVSDVPIADGFKEQGQSSVLVKSDGTYIIVFTQADGNTSDEDLDNDDWNIKKSVNGGALQVVCDAIWDQTDASIGSYNDVICIAWADGRDFSNMWKELYVNVDGVERRATDSYSYAALNTSTDGKYVAVGGAEGGGNKYIYLYNWWEDIFERLGTVVGEDQPDVAGEYVVCFNWSDNNIYIYNISTKNRELVTTDSSSLSRDPAISKSADQGRYNIVYSDYRNGAITGDDIYGSTFVETSPVPLDDLISLIVLGVSLAGLGSRKLSNNTNKERDRYALTNRILNNAFPNYHS